MASWRSKISVTIDATYTLALCSKSHQSVCKEHIPRVRDASSSVEQKGCQLGRRKIEGQVLYRILTPQEQHLCGDIMDFGTLL